MKNVRFTVRASSLEGGDVFAARRPWLALRQLHGLLVTHQLMSY